jgi:hypothetical protein
VSAPRLSEEDLRAVTERGATVGTNKQRAMARELLEARKFIDAVMAWGARPVVVDGQWVESPEYEAVKALLEAERNRRGAR